jgi:hypothetical protein
VTRRAGPRYACAGLSAPRPSPRSVEEGFLGDDVLDVAAADAVFQIRRGQQGRGRRDDDRRFERGQQHFIEFDGVRHQEEDGVAFPKSHVP